MDTRRPTVAALYVAPWGPYMGMPDVEAFDEARDARTYTGPWPVVAHPPCGPWGRLSWRCTLQDASAGPHGVAMVRRWGGVLKHPAQSKLWAACGLPRPGDLPDQWGGFALAVEQWQWGHPAIKPTWIYVCGLAEPMPPMPVPDRDRPISEVVQTSRGPKRQGVVHRQSKRDRVLTPPAFAEWLVEVARRCVSPGAAD